MIEKFKNYISQGNYVNVVCNYLNINESTFYTWINRAKKEEEEGKNTIYTKFHKAIKESEAVAEMRHLQNILKTAQDGTWQASAWYLERKHKQRWSAKQEVEYTGDNIIKVRITDD
jgi:transposase-like protein